MSLSKGRNRMQTVNLVLIVVGIFLSAAVSWRFSRRRVSEVMNLENVAKGHAVPELSDSSVYNRLQNLILTNLKESGELKLRADKYAGMLRDKAAQVIFCGLLKNAADIESVFQELGLAGSPKCFFVGVLETRKRLEEPQLPLCLKECLLIHAIHGSRSVVVFLYESDSTDPNQVQRRKLAGEIRECLHIRGIRQVRIGMSQVYTSPLMIDCAYSEAVSVLDYMVSRQTQDFCGCWENAVGDITFVMPGEDALQNFAESLQEQDLEKADKCFNHMLNKVSTQECTEENQIYARYRILQCLVEYLQEESTVEKMTLLKECLNIRVGDEREFSRSVRNVLKRCLVKKEQDHFSQMLDYIENNYSRSDLAYEEVAKAGSVSKTYVSKIFRAKLGMSYIEYLTCVRMDRACALLRTTDIQINDIVRMVGYENASGFRRCFKDRYDISAAEYRKRERLLSKDQKDEKEYT